MSIWIVEMWDGDGWAPTVGCKLCRAEGRYELLDWRKRNPDDRFRLIRYWPKEAS